MADALNATRRAGDGRIALPDAAGDRTDFDARFVEPLRVVALRGAGDGIDAIRATLSAEGGVLPDPGQFSGTDPFVLWSKPAEWLLIGTSDALADRALRELAPRRHPTACAIDQTAGVVALELEGGAVEAVLSRLVDPRAIPREPGRGTRARLGDIAVTMLRVASERTWLIAERSVEAYLVDWLRYAATNARDAEETTGPGSI